jgi:hypothetical protein
MRAWLCGRAGFVCVHVSVRAQKALLYSTSLLCLTPHANAHRLPQAHKHTSNSQTHTSATSCKTPGSGQEHTRTIKGKKAATNVHAHAGSKRSSSSTPAPVYESTSVYRLGVLATS